jgi:hypothetical protein
MGNWVDVHYASLRKLAHATKLSIGQVVGDLTRKKKQKKKVDGKTVEIQVPIHAVRVSDSPFAVTEEEKEYLQRQEVAWDNLISFNKAYAGGVPLTELEQARVSYKKHYDGQMEFAQAHGAWKSRRAEAFRDLASFSKTQKEMKEYRITNKSRDLALDNFVKIIESYSSDTDTVSGDLDKIIVNMRPSHLKGFTSLVWNAINGQNLLFIYGKKKAGRRTERYLARMQTEVHAELIKYFPSISSISPALEEPFFQGDDNLNLDQI